MLFSLFIAQASFWEYVNKIPANKVYVYVMVYFDDILIYINKADHINAIQYVLNQLKNY